MMRAMHLSELKPVVGGELSGDARFERIAIDSRKARPHSLFVAIRGERFDGHDYVREAVKHEVSAALVSTKPAIEISYLRVEDTLDALGRIGAFNRQMYPHPVIAITGSTGKTTCKQMLADILGLRQAVYATPANHNNEVGVPLCLLELNASHQMAVLELGARAPGQIGQLADWVRPDVALITNAQTAHIKGFGSARNVARAKGELLRYLSEDGVAVLNRDCDAFDYWCSVCLDDTKVVSFSAYATSDTVADVSIREHDGGLRLRTPEDEVPLVLNVPGRANRANAAAAAAAAFALGIDVETIVRGLAAAKTPPGRLQIVCEDPVILDDSYNANPHSVRAGIDVLVGYSGRRMLILGDMADLGTRSVSYHKDIGIYARDKGVQSLWCCGSEVRHTARAFGHQARFYAKRDELLRDLKQDVSADAILIKGSRSAHMELVVAHALKIFTKQ